MSEIICPTNCSAELPDFNFDDCSPVLNEGGIMRIYLTQIGQSFPDPNIMGEAAALAAWQARMSNTSAAADAIRVLTVMADKPAPSKNELTISDKRKIYLNKDHTVNIIIDEVSDENYEAMRKLECNFRMLAVFEGGNYMYGGEDDFGNGIEVLINLDDIHPQSDKELNTMTGTMTWTAKHHPTRVNNFIR